jgi:hypothetical protein
MVSVRFRIPALCNRTGLSILAIFGIYGNSGDPPFLMEPFPSFLRIIDQRAKDLGAKMFSFLLWCILLVVCWPLALLALFLYPLVWLVLLPFRLLGIAVGGALELVRAIIFLPVRLLRGRHA